MCVQKLKCLAVAMQPNVNIYAARTSDETRQDQTQRDVTSGAGGVE